MTATCQELHKRFEVITDKESELKALLKNARSAEFDKEEITGKLAELEALRKDYEKYLAESTKLPDGRKIWATDYLALKRLGNANGEGAFEKLLEKDRIDLDILGRVVRLDACRFGLKRLDGISGLTALRELLLTNNQLSDVTALAKLTSLTWLGLGRNQLSDVTALTKLTSLTELYLGDNQLTDVTVLGELTSLTELWLGSNPLTPTSQALAKSKGWLL